MKYTAIVAKRETISFAFGAKVTLVYIAIKEINTTTYSDVTFISQNFDFLVLSMLDAQSLRNSSDLTDH